VRHQKVDLVLLDLKIPGVAGAGMTGGGMSLLEEVKTLHPDTSVIVMAATGTVASAVETMRMGAEDYLSKPFALDELVTTLERASRRTHGNVEKRLLRERLRSQRRSGSLIGNSPVMEKLYRILSKVAHSTHPVLILGESGTGKELVARSIHFNGPQAAKQFIPVDCGAAAPWLIEAELFGYVSGSYPGGSEGAYSQGKDGLLVSAKGGTIFLNEVNELPLELQAKLLRALQEKVVHPLGGTHTVPIAARILASSHADLNAMVEQGKFRRDLYFRLSVVSLRIPALRQRKEDIPELAQYFLEKAPRVNGVAYTLSDEVLRGLIAYDWPGNVRELEISIERVCAMSSGPVLRVVDLPSPLREVIAQMQVEVAPVKAVRELSPGWNPENIQSIAEMERQAILETIRQLDGDKLLAAKLLGIGKTTLYRKLKEYGIQEWEGVN
jgi:two-component system response regulator HydG